MFKPKIGNYAKLILFLFPSMYSNSWMASYFFLTVPRTTPAFLPAVDSEKLSCTWNEIRNSAADESKAADRFYFQSLFQCWAYCDADSRCLVATFNSPVCQVYYVTVPPVHSVGTTYLAKSCKDTGAFLGSMLRLKGLSL